MQKEEKREKDDNVAIAMKFGVASSPSWSKSYVIHKHASQELETPTLWALLM
jgi:hypothetical protein